jgi:hypothetical protein
MVALEWPRPTGPSDQRPADTHKGRLAVAILLVLTTATSSPLTRSSFGLETSPDAGIAIDNYWNAVTTDQAGNVVAAGVEVVHDSDYSCVFAVEKISRPTGARTWRYESSDCGSDETFESSGEEQVVIDANGDVIVGRRDIGERAFGVYKLAGDTGALLWAARPGRYPKHGPFVHAIATDARGNVFVASGFGSYTLVCETDFAVTKLDAETGAELWRYTLTGTFVPTVDCEDAAFNQAQAIAVDATGNVLVSGFLVNERAASPSPRPAYQSVVVKLSGSDGAELWRRDSDASHDPDTSIAVDAGGDVLSARTHIPGTGGSANPVTTVEKRSGGTGRLLWSSSAAVAERGYSLSSTTLLSLAGPDDLTVIRAVRPPTGLSVSVVKIDASSGAVRWRRDLMTSGNHLRWKRARRGRRRADTAPLAMASDAAGNVVLGGAIQQPGYETDTVSDLFVTKLAARTGAEVWHHTLDGPAHLTDEVRALAIDGDDVVAAGSWEVTGTDADALAVILDGQTGNEIWRAGAGGRVPGGTGGECCPAACQPGQSCSDGDACTVGDACVGGACVGGPARDCDDGNVCTNDRCTAADGCTHAPNTAPCVSTDPCMATGRCAGGACLPLAASAAEITCAMNELLATPCGTGEDPPARLRKLIRHHVKRAARSLARAEVVAAKDKQHEALRLREHAETQLEAIARRAARATAAPRPRISSACGEAIGRLAARHRSLIGSVGF